MFPALSRNSWNIRSENEKNRSVAADLFNQPEPPKIVLGPFYGGDDIPKRADGKGVGELMVGNNGYAPVRMIKHMMASTGSF
jgi:hypothetical protein